MLASSNSKDSKTFIVEHGTGTIQAAANATNQNSQPWSYVSHMAKADGIVNHDRRPFLIKSFEKPVWLDQERD